MGTSDSKSLKNSTNLSSCSSSSSSKSNQSKLELSRCDQSTQPKEAKQNPFFDHNSQETKNFILTNFSQEYPQYSWRSFYYLKTHHRTAPVEKLRAILHCWYEHFVGWIMLNKQITDDGDSALMFAINNQAPHLINPLLDLEPPPGYDPVNVNELTKNGALAVTLVSIAYGSYGYNDFHQWGPSIFDRLLKQTSNSALRSQSKKNRSLLHDLLVGWHGLVSRETCDVLIQKGFILDYRPHVQVVKPDNNSLLEYIASTFSRKSKDLKDLKDLKSSNSDDKVPATSIELTRAFTTSIKLLLERADHDGGGGISLTSLNWNGKTALDEVNKILNPLKASSPEEACLWQDIKARIATETRLTKEYASQLLPSLTIVLNDSLKGVQGLYQLIASYSPCTDSSHWFLEPHEYY